MQCVSRKASNGSAARTAPARPRLATRMAERLKTKRHGKSKIPGAALSATSVPHLAWGQSLKCERSARRGGACDGKQLSHSHESAKNCRHHGRPRRRRAGSVPALAREPRHCRALHADHFRGCGGLARVRGEVRPVVFCTGHFPRRVAEKFLRHRATERAGSARRSRRKRSNPARSVRRRVRAGFTYVDRAIDAALAGEVAAVSTAPLNKEALHRAGIPFPGHTEIFAARTNAARSCMMQYSEEITCSFVTVHVGYRDVPALLSRRTHPRRDRTHGRGACERIRGRQPKLAFAA